MKKKNIQWHPGFVAAMNLELSDARDSLIFEKEYNLNTKPLAIDLLVIKKEKAVQITNEIGSFFRGHNIMEYKSPDDELDIDVFYKTGAYASLYKSYGEKSDAVKADDITVSILRERKPLKLFHYFQEHGYCVSNPYHGVYYIENEVLFPTQIIVTKELERGQHIWLTSLSEQLQEQDMRELVKSIRTLEGKADKEFADSILQVSIGANKQVVEKLIGDDNMCEALMELMEPQIALREKELEKKIEKQVEKRMREESLQREKKMREENLFREKAAKENGIQQGIRATVNALRNFGCSAADIQKSLMEQYGLTAETAGKYI